MPPTRPGSRSSCPGSRTRTFPGRNGHLPKFQLWRRDIPPPINQFQLRRLNIPLPINKISTKASNLRRSIKFHLRRRVIPPPINFNYGVNISPPINQISNKASRLPPPIIFKYGVEIFLRHRDLSQKLGPSLVPSPHFPLSPMKPRVHRTVLTLRGCVGDEASYHHGPFHVAPL